MARNYFYLLILTFTLTSCISNKPLYKISTEPGKLKRMIPDSEVFEKGFTGFALYDPDKNEWLYQYHSNKLFTPASNTKILTLYTTLQIIGDSIAFAAIEEEENDLTVYGLGDPTFLHPAFNQNEKIWAELSNGTNEIAFSDGHMTSDRFGPGWAWDDFRYYFQPERTYLPLYGNVVRYNVTANGNLRTEPAYFESFTNIRHASNTEGCKVERDEFSNSFTFVDGIDCDPGSEVSTPYNVYPYLTKELLEDTIKNEVAIKYAHTPDIPLTNIWYSTPSDTVFRRMMHQSDNFIAEQLMLQASAISLGYMNPDSLIQVITRQVKKIIPDSIRWVDASGLSRYNLISPRSIVLILDQLQEQEGMEKMMDLFPAGGLDGTISQWYGTGDKPYVFAKTGSMSNVHCLSGYLMTDSGRLLIFSFMHRQFYESNKEHKNEMEKILEYIKVAY